MREQRAEQEQSAGMCAALDSCSFPASQPEETALTLSGLSCASSSETRTSNRIGRMH
jgi:hypothetical protein